MAPDLLGTVHHTGGQTMIRILGALGIGALAMYFFDPQNGRRRRALMRDKAVHYHKEAREYADATYQDLRNRAQGAIAETRGYVEQRLGKRAEQPKVDIDLSQPQP
jgi:hypothetical protein